MKVTHFFPTLILRADKGKGKGEVKVHLRTGYEGSDGE
jgi:hypothetical protein